MKVRQLMSRNVVAVGPSDSCLEAVARTHRAPVRHLPVVDAKAAPPIAPDLSTVGAKHSEAYLRAWLRDPKQQKPGAHMPKLELSKAEVRALAAYLASLR